MRRILALSIVTALLALVAAGRAHAGFAPASEAIIDAPGLGFYRVAVDQQGNSTVVWSEFAADNNVGEVKARRVSATGAVGPVLDVSPPVPGEHHFAPDVAVAPNGRALVAWRTGPTENPPHGVSARWVEPDGTLGPLHTLVTGSGTVNAVRVLVETDPAGTATAVWENQVDNHLMARRVRQDNSLSALVDDVTGGVHVSGDADIAPLANGSTLAVWRNAGIYSNVLFPDESVGTASPLVVGGLVAEPAVAADGQGNALATWRFSPAMDVNSVRGWRFDPSGAPVGSELVVDPDSPGSVGIDVLPAADSANDFLVAWSRSASGNNSAAYARRLDKDGNFAGPPQVLSQTDGDAINPFPALEDRGSGIVAWVAGAGTQGRTLDAFGAPVGDIATLVGGGNGEVHGGSTPSGGVAAFLSLVGGATSDSLFLSRYLVPPLCSGSRANAVQGRLLELPLACTGPAIEAVEIVDPPDHGTTGPFNAAGPAIAYTPAANFGGSDSFSFRAVNDGGTSAPTAVQIAVQDNLVPGIRRFSFRQGSTRATAAGTRRRRARRRTFTVVLGYSEPARATVTVERPVRGIRRGRRCRPRSRRTRGGRRCTAYRRVGTVSVRRLATSSSTRISGRLLRRLARGGRYRLTAVATDAAGNKSRARRLRVRISAPAARPSPPPRPARAGGRASAQGRR